MNPLEGVDTLLFDMDGTLTDLWKRYRDPFYRALDKVRPDHDRKKVQEVFESVVTEVLTTSEGSSRLLKVKLFLKSRKEMG